MGMTSVTLDGMRSAGGSIGSTVASLQRDLNMISGEIQSLQATWTGQAATSFYQAANEWADYSNRVLQVLDGFVEKMGRSAGTYNASHLDAVDGVTGFTNLVSGLAL